MFLIILFVFIIAVREPNVDCLLIVELGMLSNKYYKHILITRTNLNETKILY